MIFTRTTLHSITRVLPRRLAAPLLLAALTASGAACDRVTSALRRDPPVDARWQGDSALLASNPQVIFQRYERFGGTRIVPWATVGKNGFHLLAFAPRGWRAFDVNYLAKGAKLTALRDGRGAEQVTILRGMWDGSQLDSLPLCPNPTPAATAELPSDIRLLTNHTPPPLNPVGSLSSGELAEVLGTVPTLIAPTLGVGGTALARYRREVHVIASGATNRPTILVIYDDPESLPDSVAAIAQRPRHLIVALDRGVYGYRPSFTYKTVGNAKDGRRYYYKDFADLDGDGRAELVLGLRGYQSEEGRYADLGLATIVLRFENESWREMLRWDGSRCSF